FSLTNAAQDFRFQMRIHDPLTQWKLSPMAMSIRIHWKEYTKAKEEMLARTHTEDAPWWVGQAVDKKRARLNCIAHLLDQIPYEDVPKPEIQLPDRIRH
ncbi:polyphosphate kinase 2, partial [Rhizobium ruizarguesonis]